MAEFKSNYGPKYALSLYTVIDIGRRVSRSHERICDFGDIEMGELNLEMVTLANALQ